MDYIQPYLDYFSAHPDWAIALIFLIAFGEALLIIGLFVPSTAVLVGAGILVWVWKRFGLADPQRRADFLRHGLLTER